MATVVKNFRIKSGLVVEGTTGTINGQNILTETGGDAYILNLVGGATLVKSVGTNLSVDGAGELSLDLVGIAEDIAGTRLTTDGSTLNVDVDGIANDLTGSYDFATNSDVSMAVGTEATNRDSAIATAKGEAISTAATDATNKANAAQAAAEATASADATSKANAAQAAAEATASADATSKANAAQAAAEATAASDATSKANTAEQNAKDYADELINDASSSSAEVWSAYKTSTEIGLAQAAAEQHADDAVAALVGSAPAVLDTIQELATALENNPDIIADLENVAAGKQNTLTAGSNIDITADVISVTGLDSADISDFNTAALSATSAAYDAAGSASAAQTAAQSYADGLAVNYDAAGSASAAQTAAQSYADGLAVNYDAAGSASAAQTAAEGYADGLVDNLVDGTTAFTEINVNDEAKHIAATSASLGSVPVTAYQWAKADFRSGKFLVKIDNGTHNEISEILVTLDSSDNVAITEYAIVGTNGSRGTITASVSGANVQLRVDPVNDSTIKVTGTLLK